MREIVFLWRVFSLIFVSHGLGIRFNSLHTQAPSIGLGLDGLKSQPKTHNQVTWFITINHQDHNPWKLGPNCLYIRLNKLYLHIIVVNKKHPVCSSFSPTSFITFVVSYFFQLLFFSFPKCWISSFSFLPNQKNNKTTKREVSFLGKLSHVPFSFVLWFVFRSLTTMAYHSFNLWSQTLI